MVREASHCVWCRRDAAKDASYESSGGGGGGGATVAEGGEGRAAYYNGAGSGKQREMTPLLEDVCLCVGTWSRESDGSLFPHFLMNTGIAESLLHFTVHGSPKHLC